MDGHTLCPLCQHQNPTENRSCGRCGVSLSGSRQLVPRPKGGFLVAAGRAVPARLKPVGKALAVGAAALAVEAFLSRLGRRAEVHTPSSLTAARGSEPAAVPGRLVVGGGLEEVFVLLDEGRWRGRVIERRAARWFYATETIDRPRWGALLPRKGR
jgi:hypothetical protein